MSKARIKELRDAAQAALDKQTAILEAVKAANRSDMTVEERAAFDAAGTEADNALAAIVPLEAVVARAARIQAVDVTEPEPVAERDATGVLDAVTRGVERDAAPAIAKSPDAWKIELGCYAWATARAKQYPRRTPLEHLEDFGLQQLSDKAKAHTTAIAKDMARTLGAGNPVVLRTLTSLTGGGGDNMITTPLSTEFIEFLRANSAFMAGNPMQIDMPMGALDIPGGNAGATGTYHAENADLGYTEATTRKVNLSAKHIGAVTAFSNYLLDISPISVASIFGEDLVQGIAQGIDSAGLRGDGTGSNPSGVLTLTHATHKITAVNATAPTLAQVDADAKNAMTKLDTSLVPKRRRRWLMSSRVFRYLQFMRDGNGNLVFPGLSLPSPVWYDNIPVTVSEQIPSALGAGTNESEIYLCDFGHVLMGVTRSLRLKASTEASYKNAGGTLVSAFSRDETVVRGMASHDFDMRHTKACVVLQAVKWGA